jgi:MFS family permease
MFALGSARELGLDSPWIPTSLVLGAVGLAAFVAIERRVPEPLLPLEFFRSRNFSATLLTNGLTNAAYMGGFIISPLFLDQIFGYSTTVIAFIMLIRVASLTLSSPVGGGLGERMGERWASVFGCGLMTAALALIAWSAWNESIVAFAIGLVGQGVGHGLSQPSITAAISRSVDESDLGIAAAANRLLGQGGAAFGITALSLAYGGVNEGRAFALAFAAGAAFSGLSVLTAVGIAARRIVLERSVPASP